MLEHYFSDDYIIDQLCKERVKLAGFTHDRQHISHLAGHNSEPLSNHPFYCLLPSRKQWNQFRPRRRKSNRNPDLVAVKRAVEVLRQQVPHQPWVNELNRYIAAIRERVFGCHPFQFTKPEIGWKRKKPGGHEYRALCQFLPDDNLILCLFARYLRDEFDSGFSNSSMAFRAPGSGGKAPTHHDAFDQIFQLKHSAPTKDFFVGEADIKGFYDSVDHEIALAAFREAALGKSLHHRAEVIFRAYLNCYSFPVSVLAEAEPRLKRLSDPEGFFKWPAGSLKKFHGKPHTQRIGVAQGGAISGVIANLVLDAADKAVERETHKLGAEIHYYRFCDDMVLISPVKRHCEIAYAAYLKALDTLKLPYHLPKQTFIYGPKHWDNKSKAPYCWSGRKWFGCVPWLQFVGYQVRYDGLVRPRKESLQKQVKKLEETRVKLTTGLRKASQEHPILANRNQARSSLKAKLVVQGVGRIKCDGLVGPKPMCWAAGFKGLHNKPFIPASLRGLDRARSEQIHKFDGAKLKYGRGRRGQGDRRPDPIGYLFSYEGQFENAGGVELIQHPWRPGKPKDIFRTLLFSKIKKISRWMPGRVKEIMTSIYIWSLR